MTNEIDEILQYAKNLASTAPHWAEFYRDVFGVEGFARKRLSSGGYEIFEKSPEYQELLLIVAQLLGTSYSQTDEPIRMITIRIEKSVHDLLCERANTLNVSVNTFCLMALLQPLQSLDSDVATDPLGEEHQRMITVRLPLSLQEVIADEANRFSSPINRIAKTKITRLLELSLDKSRALFSNVRKVNRRGRNAGASNLVPLSFVLDPGTASAEEIAELLSEFSTLYKLVGGRGIQFTVTDARQPVPEGALS